MFCNRFIKWWYLKHINCLVLPIFVRGSWALCATLARSFCLSIVIYVSLQKLRGQTNCSLGPSCHFGWGCIAASSEMGPDINISDRKVTASLPVTTSLRSVKKVIYNERTQGFNGIHVHGPSRGPLLLSDFIYLFIWIKEPWAAGQGTRVEQSAWDEKQPWVSDLRTTRASETAYSLFQLKRDATEKPSYDPCGLGLESRSFIMLGAHIFKERRTAVSKTWRNHIYLQIEPWHCRLSGYLKGPVSHGESRSLHHWAPIQTPSFL